jgi:hypothetical protein
VIDSTFTGNSCIGLSAQSAGGGIFSTAGPLTFIGSTFSDNTLTTGGLSEGGGVYNESNCTMSDCTVVGNSAQSGGGVSIRAT